MINKRITARAQPDSLKARVAAVPMDNCKRHQTDQRAEARVSKYSLFSIRPEALSQTKHGVAPRSCQIFQQVPVAQFHSCVQQGPPASVVVGLNFFLGFCSGIITMVW